MAPAGRHELRARVERLPGMAVLLDALSGQPPAYLVGGAVRDLLRGEDAVDLDVAIEGDAAAAARAIADTVGVEPVEHPRFGTATVNAPVLRVDLAATRSERYPEPGALPEVAPASLAEDLARRDFTINAMAIGLSGDDLGRLYDPHGGGRDLAARVIRVLHERSFRDDPTRLLRAIRYAARVDGELEPGTERLFEDALAAAAIDTVSGPRIRAELVDLLAETAVADAVFLLHRLQLDRALHPALHADADLVASAALAAGETGADRVLAALAALVSAAPGELAEWLDRLGLTRSDRDRTLRAATAGPLLARSLAEDLAPSETHGLLRGEPAEALALALALGAPARPVLSFVGELRGVRLDITGDDLVAAGIAASPALGAALAETLRQKLDGRVSGRRAELALALELARSEAG